MVKIKIGPNERDIDGVDESWINKEVNRLRKEQGSVCVRVTIREGNMNVMFSTPDCPGSGGGALNRDEKKILDLWKKHRLSESDFHGGDVVAFLKQLMKSL